MAEEGGGKRARHHPPFHKARTGSRKTDVYEVRTVLNSGTYGDVYRAELKEKPKGSSDDGVRALKKLKVLDEKQKESGFPVTALREIIIMKQLVDPSIDPKLRHPNIGIMQEVVVDPLALANLDAGMGVCMAMDYMHYDLAGLCKNKAVTFLPGHVMCIGYQLLEGVLYMHSKGIMHRDLKAANILMTKSGVVKITDFGLARHFEQEGLHSAPVQYTLNVVTPWYRPPEIFNQIKEYSPQIDVWGVGCIIAEMLLPEPLFSKSGGAEMEIFKEIYNLCGTPIVEAVSHNVDAGRTNEHGREDEGEKGNYWPGLKTCTAYQNAVPKTIHRQLRHELNKRFTDFCKGKREMLQMLQLCMPQLLDLLDGLLTLDPKLRLTPKQAALMDFFWMEHPIRSNLFELAQILPENACHDSTKRKA